MLCLVGTSQLGMAGVTHCLEGRSVLEDKQTVMKTLGQLGRRNQDCRAGWVTSDSTCHRTNQLGTESSRSCFDSLAMKTEYPVGKAPA